MFADLAIMTSSTGGTGALTLTAVTGWPGWADVFGASGTRSVSYCAVEYTDATLAVPARAEGGVGTLTLSTLSLARTKVLWSWSGTTYVNVAPSAVSLGTTAANVRVRCAPLASMPAHGAPWVAQSSPADTDGHPPFNMQVAAGTYTFAANHEIYVPWRHAAAGELTGAKIIVTTAAGTGIKAAVYELAAGGGPGRKLLDVASTTPFATGTTGAKTATLSKWLAPGWYYYGLIADGAAVVRAATQTEPGPQGTNSGAATVFFDISGGSFSTGLPATATTSLVLSASATPPVLFPKTRN